MFQAHSHTVMRLFGRPKREFRESKLSDNMFNLEIDINSCHRHMRMFREFLRRDIRNHFPFAFSHKPEDVGTCRL